MNTYEFILTFKLPDNAYEPEYYLDALYEAGCGDALAGIGQSGCIALEFERKAKSAEAAVHSAINNVRSAIPGAELIEAKPDLVGLTDVANILNCTRQNVRKYMVNNLDFPKPTYSGTASLWHLWEIAKFQKFAFPKSLTDISKTTFKINLDIQNRRYGKLNRSKPD
jgi:hypothetical protein